MDHVTKQARLRQIALGTGCLALVVVGAALYHSGLFTDDSDPYASSDCTIAGVVAHGDFVTYLSQPNPDYTEASSELIVEAIEQADATDNITGIFIDIDSFGGVPLAGEEIAQALKHATKPTVALIRGAGTSAAYWAATGADHIIASPLSNVGSIGATFSYTDAAAHNQREGYTFNQLSTGIYKDYGNPDKPLTAGERALIMRDLVTIKDRFVAAVAASRGMSIAQVERLADGSSMLGEAAQKAGLVDEMGSYNEAKAWLAKESGADGMICW